MPNELMSTNYHLITVAAGNIDMLLAQALLASFFARSLTLVPRSLLLNRTETLATQANML